MSYDLSFYNFGSQETIVDARFAGNKSRFMNHGDLGADNVEAKIISSGGRTRIGFFSKRNIRFEE